MGHGCPNTRHEKIISLGRVEIAERGSIHKLYMYLYLIHIIYNIYIYIILLYIYIIICLYISNIVHLVKHWSTSSYA